MATVVNARDVLLQTAAVRIIPTSPGVTSAAGSTFIAANDLSTVTPASITLNSNITSLPSASVQWYKIVGGVDTIISGATSSSYTLSATTFLADLGSNVSMQYKAVGSVGGLSTSVIMTVYLIKNGATGPVSTTPGPPGATGTSKHKAYIALSAGSAPGAPANTVSGAAPSGYSLSPVSVSVGQAQFETDGTTASGSTTTTWSVPYLSYFKVATLEAIVAYTGALIVDNSGNIRSDGKTSYSSGVSGFWLGYDGGTYKFNIGDSSQYLKWNGSSLDVNSAGSAIFRGSSNAPSGLFSAALVGAGSGSLGGIGGEASTTNSSAVGGYFYGYGGVYSQAANSGGIGVQAINNQSGGTGLRVVGRINWSGTTWASPDNSPVFNNPAYFLCADGTWKAAGSAFTPVQQGGGTNQGTNKLYIGWGNLGTSKLFVQVDATNFGSTWPIDISGQASYAANANNAYLFDGNSSSAVVTATNAAINAAINSNNSNVVMRYNTYTISIPSLGGAWSCSIY